MNATLQVVLHKLCQLFHDNNIRFALGGSCLLYYHGIPVNPADIDILIDERDIDSLLRCIEPFQSVETDPSTIYTTTWFRSLKMDGIKIDVMSNFAIQTKNEHYHFPFAIETTVIENNLNIPLSSLREWELAYTHMNRLDKVKQIQKRLSFRLETPRLYLRHISHLDVEAMVPYVSDETNMYYERAPMNEQTLRQFLTAVIPLSRMYAIIRTVDHQFLGHIYIGPTSPADFREYTIGYILAPRFHRKGYCSEAIQRIIQYAFEDLGAHRVTARCNPDNIGSWKVMEKVGLLKEGHLKQRVCFKTDSAGQPIWWDELIYGIPYNNWKETNS